MSKNDTREQKKADHLLSFIGKRKLWDAGLIPCTAKDAYIGPGFMIFPITRRPGGSPANNRQWDLSSETREIITYYKNMAFMAAQSIDIFFALTDENQDNPILVNEKDCLVINVSEKWYRVTPKPNKGVRPSSSKSEERVVAVRRRR